MTEKISIAYENVTFFRVGLQVKRAWMIIKTSEFSFSKKMRIHLTVLEFKALGTNKEKKRFQTYFYEIMHKLVSDLHRWLKYLHNNICKIEAVIALLNQRTSSMLEVSTKVNYLYNLLTRTNLTAKGLNLILRVLLEVCEVLTFFFNHKDSSKV